MVGTKRELEMVEMRMNGATYKAIGERFGVTKQRVYEIIKRRFGKVAIGIRSQIDIEDIVYEGIYRHFKETDQTFANFVKAVFVYNVPKNQQRAIAFITGKHETYLQIKHIKRICNVCGMPFEEVFKERVKCEEETAKEN